MSNIEWTDETWNPVTGCTPVSPGCLNCYAAGMARRLEAMGRPEYVGLTVHRKVAPKRFPNEEVEDLVVGGRCAVGSRVVFSGKVNCLEDRLAEPLHWRKPRRVFVNSMSDLFHEAVPFEFIDRVFALMALCPQHTFQVLTKRPERMAEYLREFYREGGRLEGMMGEWEMDHDPWHGRLSVDDDLYRRLGEIDSLTNVWLGTSVEDQARADERIPHLLKCPAAVRFLSVEPLLGAVDLEPWLCSSCGGSGKVGLDDDERELVRCGSCMGQGNSGLHWVIVGGESGAKARPCDVQWIRGVVQQCRAAKVPVFVKQLGAWPWWKQDRCLCSECCRNAWPERYRMRLNDRKGGDPAEWPEDLRVREFPTMRP